jgi:AcrR family transcriptional regulator
MAVLNRPVQNYNQPKSKLSRSADVARPRAYDRDSAIIAARDLFWERGYEATTISELEAGTGLNRSSLYHEFGSKHALLDTALSCYAEEVVAPLLADLHGPAASLETVVAFFARLAALFRSAARPATHGCLLVNTVAELAARDERVRAAGADYHRRLRGAFGAALANAGRLGEIDAGTVETRAELLSALLLGAWLTVRVDADAAQDLCRAVEREVDSWRPR